jgi:hypothetical protein
MVSRVAASERLAQSGSADRDAFERSLYAALGEIRRTRPRIVEFAPHEALARALARAGNGARRAPIRDVLSGSRHRARDMAA